MMLGLERVDTQGGIARQKVSLYHVKLYFHGGAKARIALRQVCAHQTGKFLVLVQHKNRWLTRDVLVPKPVSRVCSVLVAVVNWLSRLLLTYRTSNKSVGWS
jgi:hypothetical protein